MFTIACCLVIQMKLFKTVNNVVIQDCCNFLTFILSSDLLAVRYATFSNRYIECIKNLHWNFWT